MARHKAQNFLIFISSLFLLFLSTLCTLIYTHGSPLIIATLLSFLEAECRAMAEAG
jgi:hypothetical protein